MSNFYQTFEDALYTVLTALFPTIPIVFAYDNGPEDVTPYCTIQVVSLDQIGRESTSSLANNGKVQYIKHYEGFVSIKFIGDGGSQVAAGNAAADFDYLLESPAVQDLLLINNLSFMRKSVIRRIPMRWDTVWYMGYQSDVTFAFSVESEQSVDTIETVVMEGVFTHPYPAPPIVVTETIN